MKGNNNSSLCHQLEHGIILPTWHPDPSQAAGVVRAAMAIVYIIFMTYLFTGLAMIVGILVGALEKVVSKKRKIKANNGAVQVSVWNETVANLTILALGSCAPELSLVLVDAFSTAKLGPATVVGTSAFNIFIVQAIGISSLVREQTKKVNNFRNYFATASLSVFAFIWLYIVLVSSSSGIIEIWEALLTLLFYPISVGLIFAVDKQFFGFFSEKHICFSNKISPSAQPEHGTNQPSVTERYSQLMEEFRRKFPNKTTEDLQQLATNEILKEKSKRRGYYRMLVSAAGCYDDVKIDTEIQKISRETTGIVGNAGVFEAGNCGQVIAFDPDCYSVMEDVGVFYVSVTRSGAGLENITTVDYRTRDGTGKAGVDYDAACGSLVFNRGERLKHIPLHVIDDDEFNDDTEFYVDLFEARLIALDKASSARLAITLAGGGVATVKKMDDDQGGIFHLERSDEIRICEHVGEMAVKIVRSAGAKGRVELPVHIHPVTALANVHYEQITSNNIVFEARQTMQWLKIKIFNEGLLKKEKSFKIELGEPTWHLNNQRETAKKSRQSRLSRATQYQRKGMTSRQSHVSLNSRKYEINDKFADMDDELDAILDMKRLGKPRLTEPRSLAVTITENVNLNTALEKLASADVSDLVPTTTWKHQFRQAVTVSSSTKPTKRDYLFHALLVVWKIVIATIPPSHLASGWVTAVWSLVYIGAVVVLIIDCASHFSCTTGLHHEITAMLFVPLGIRLPDAIACRLAAIGEKKADAAIGSINGAVAVTVFLGLGLAWSMAAINLHGQGAVLQIDQPFATTCVTFAISAAVANAVVMLRRLSPVRGEIGGPMFLQIATVVLFGFLWLINIILCALYYYGYVNT